jgi:hypothetical protein
LAIGVHEDSSYALDEMMKESDEQIGLPLTHAIREVFSQPYLRKATTIGILSLQIVVGIWPIIFISTDLLEGNFDNEMAQYSSFSFILANFLASILGMCVVEKCGRRPMLIWSGIANTLCLIAYIICDRMAEWYLRDFRYGCVISLVCYGITYGAALGPIAFFITSELVPQRFRSLVQSIVFAFNTIVNFAFSFVTLPAYRWIGVWAFLPLFILPSIISLVYLFYNLPETKNFEIYEIVGQLIRTSSQCSSTDGIISSSTSSSKNATATETTTSKTCTTESLSEEDNAISSIGKFNYATNIALATNGSTSLPKFYSGEKPQIV